MKKHKNETADVLILERGEELMSALLDYTEESNLTGAWLKSGLGGAENVVLSFYDLDKKEYIDKTFDEPLEILSLQGNLAWVDDKPFWHVHGVFGTSDYKSIGGHVKSLVIALTGELYISPLDVQMTRAYDETTGLKLLN